MNNSRDRRGSRRFEVSGVRGRMEARVAARVLNLSLTGMSIETDEPLVVGKACQVELEHDDLAFEAVGTVVWSRPRDLAAEEPEVSRGLPRREPSTVYEAGVRFDSDTSSLRALLGSSAVILFEDDGLAAALMADQQRRDCRLIELAPGRLVVLTADEPTSQNLLLTLDIDGRAVRLPGRLESSSPGPRGWRVEVTLGEIPAEARAALRGLVQSELQEGVR